MGFNTYGGAPPPVTPIDPKTGKPYPIQAGNGATATAYGTSGSGWGGQDGWGIGAGFLPRVDDGNWGGISELQKRGILPRTADANWDSYAPINDVKQIQAGGGLTVGSGGQFGGGGLSGDQKAAIGQASTEAKALGTEQRSYFEGANNKAQGYYGAAAGAIGDQRANAPTQSRDAYGQIAPGLGNNTYQEDLAQNPGYATSPGAVGSYYGQQSGQRGPSQVQDLYGQQQGSAGPSQSRSYFGQQSGALAGPGAAEQNATTRLAGGVQPGALDQRYGQAQSYAAGPDAVTQRYQQRQAGPQTGTLDAYSASEQQKGGPQNSQGVFDQSSGGLARNGYSENLLGSQTYGNNKTDVENLYSQRVAAGDPAANYEDKRAVESINNQLAARGRFNSGPGVRQISDYFANVGAQRSHQMADLASASSGEAGKRATYLSDLAGQSDTKRIAATELRGNLAKNADATNIEGRKYLGDLAQNVDKNQLERQGQIDTLSRDTSASGLDRQKLLGDLATGVDKNQIQKQEDLDALAKTSQDAQNTRIVTGGGLARDASAEQSGQQKYLAGLAVDASGEQAKRDDYLAGLARDTGAEERNKATYGLDAAKGADTARYNNNQLQGDLAGKASAETRNYYGDLTDATGKLAQNQADTASGLLTTGGTQYNSDQMAGIEAKMKAAGINTSGMDAASLIKLATSLFGALK